MPLKRLTDDERALMEANLHLAEQCAATVFRRWGTSHTTHTLEELTSYAYIGLAGAVARYKQEQGNFANFAYHHIKGAINDGLRSDSPLSKADRKRQHLDRRLEHEAASGMPAEINTQERLLLKRAAPPQFVGGITEVSAQGPGIETVVDRHDKLEKIMAIVAEAELTPREREVFNFRVFDSRSLESVAQLLEISEGAISRRQAAALNKVIAAAREQHLID